jgi:hypothetical protein
MWIYIVNILQKYVNHYYIIYIYIYIYIVTRNNNINYNIEDFQKDKMKKLENYKSNDL